MLIQERLQLILKMHSLSPSAFADQIGVQRSNVSHVISGRNKPSLDFLEKIINTFPRVNAHWLITGEMPKLIPDEQKENVKFGTEDKESSVTGNPDVRSSKEIVKIVEFYADETFKSYLPS